MYGWDRSFLDGSEYLTVGNPFKMLELGPWRITIKQIILKSLTFTLNNNNNNKRLNNN